MEALRAGNSAGPPMNREEPPGDTPGRRPTTTQSETQWPQSGRRVGNSSAPQTEFACKRILYSNGWGKSVPLAAGAAHNACSEPARFIRISLLGCQVEWLGWMRERRPASVPRFNQYHPEWSPSEPAELAFSAGCDSVISSAAIYRRLPPQALEDELLPRAFSCLPSAPGSV